MLLVNIPFVIGWVAIRQASGVEQIFLGFLLLGLAKGLMEAAVTTYHGEIWLVQFSPLSSVASVTTKYETFSFVLFSDSDSKVSRHFGER